uniref:Uncharacterized protein n=1 Tax=Odontella aurita TaxID=265563 RepID=A0A7S4M9K7_9STRA|mmetsp:Transcript_14845/g.43290  ORF Transcript_14845/g.43290 Transcript_14845/m.43290 type:complete len:259 (+) Transcript_14845:395-1171(+)
MGDGRKCSSAHQQAPEFNFDPSGNISYIINFCHCKLHIMSSSLEKLTREIDELSIRRSEETSNERHKKVRAKKELRSIYKKYAPQKIPDLGALLGKYNGQEDALLEAVERKYCKVQAAESMAGKKWCYVLKHYPAPCDDNKSSQMAKWEVDDSLEHIEDILAELAQSIGGECVINMRKGKRQLIVKSKPARFEEKSYTTETVEGTVEKMRELIHKRYRHKDSASNHSDKHSRRKAEKKLDKKRRAALVKSRRSRRVCQ